MLVKLVMNKGTLGRPESVTSIREVTFVDVDINYGDDFVVFEGSKSEQTLGEAISLMGDSIEFFESVGVDVNATYPAAVSAFKFVENCVCVVLGNTTVYAQEGDYNALVESLFKGEGGILPCMDLETYKRVLRPLERIFENAFEDDRLEAWLEENR